jgi:hypothetical protein
MQRKCRLCVLHESLSSLSFSLAHSVAMADNDAGGGDEQNNDSAYYDDAGNLSHVVQVNKFCIFLVIKPLFTI